MRLLSRSRFLPLIGATTIGAVLMYFLDPDRGKRRRHLLGDRLGLAVRDAAEGAGKASRHLANRVHGLGAEARAAVVRDDADDVVLAERVRAELGRAVSHPGAIEVHVCDGCAVLTGDIFASEADELLRRVRGVRGVRGVEDYLSRYSRALGIPSLQS